MYFQVTLDRCVLVLDNTEDACLGMFESETVTMAMGLLAAVLEGEVKVCPINIGLYNHKAYPP